MDAPDRGRSISRRIRGGRRRDSGLVIATAAKVVVRPGSLAPALAIATGCGVAGSDASPRDEPLRNASGVRFIGSGDPNKVSKDLATALGAGEIEQVVDLLTGSMSVTHVTVDAPFDRPSVIGEWATSIHS